jgi:hypothetical protein
MKNTKSPCVNISTESYTGKEQSPKRFGLSAEGFDINYEKEGYDKLIWSVQYKNNRKVWVRKINISKITHEEPVLTSLPKPPILIDTKNIDDINININKEEKKKTDYNLFIKYYLDKLKADNKDKTPAKILFQSATQEWNRLKKSPDELKKIMDIIKK